VFRFHEAAVRDLTHPARKRVLPYGRFGVTQLMERAKLLKRVFEIDLEHWQNCGDDLKITAAILEQPVIGTKLRELGVGR
jgi:hypothetical protein